MGGKESKLDVISYEDAVKRVGDAELSRLRDGFRKLSNINSCISLTIFHKEVLGDEAPVHLSERLYEIFGGTSKGLSFKDFLCGWSLLKTGSREEKLKLIFGLYSEDFQFVDKTFMDTLVTATEGNVPHELNELFMTSDRVSYSTFRSFILLHPDLLSVTQWLLSPPPSPALPPPTFYQTLGGVTHLELRELAELEQIFCSLGPRLDLHTLRTLVCPPLPEDIVEPLFNAFDENHDGIIDFKELVCGISASTRGPESERHKFIFKMFSSLSSRISSSELLTLIQSFLSVSETSGSLDKLDSVSAAAILDHLLAGREHLPLGDFLMWMLDAELGQSTVSALSEMSHVVLGLRPRDRREEKSAVVGWLSRCSRLPPLPGQSFYLISMSWWRQWLNYVDHSGVVPGPIDNSSLTVPRTVNSVTDEGAILRKDKVLVKGRDYEVLPPSVWSALWHWWGGGVALPRTVIVTDEGPQLELYPINIKIYRHQRVNGLNNNGSLTFRRYLAHYACFSRQMTLTELYGSLSGRLRLCRDDVRLWRYDDDISLLDDQSPLPLHHHLQDGCSLLVEVRSRDLSWPEDSHLTVHNALLPGLVNLGNTCYINSALQCLSHTPVLSDYFLCKAHLFELNRANALGCKGQLALSFAQLISELRTRPKGPVAPVKVRWTVAKHEPRFNGSTQHDCQEVLVTVLDGLHEDLNRVHDRPYVELKDSDGRPDDIVANEAWDNHLSRNQSIVVDLFHGQLKSSVSCDQCQYESSRFDPFTCLSLPVPMETSISMEIIVIWQDGSIPVRYGLQLTTEDTYGTLKERLSALCGLDSSSLLLAEVQGCIVRSMPPDAARCCVSVLCGLWAYELPAGLRPLTLLHRKWVKGDLEYQRPCVFGTPLIVGQGHTKRGLYETVWKLVQRLLNKEGKTPHNHTDNHTVNNHTTVNNHESPHNHATDCDDSLHSNFPFQLKIVSADGVHCVKCPWFRCCYGCVIPCTDELLEDVMTCVSIDWEATALHLKYKSTQDKLSYDDASVELCRSLVASSVSLAKCLQSFTSPESLDVPWLCPRCKTPQRAHKCLSIYRLPPVLIVHLKRFQLTNNKWTKCTKVVTFPLTDLHLDEVAVGGQDRYDLYALASHSGHITYGHYIAYIRHEGKWYCLNDSMCKEVSEPQVDTDSAYILFYQRRDLNLATFLPNLEGRTPDSGQLDDDCESELKKMCQVM